MKNVFGTMFRALTISAVLIQSFGLNFMSLGGVSTPEAYAQAVNAPGPDFDMEVTKTETSGTTGEYNAGEIVTYRIEFSNIAAGNGAVNMITVTDTYDAGLMFNGVTAQSKDDLGTFNHNTAARTLEWKDFDLAASEVGYIDLEFTVDDAALVGDVYNNASTVEACNTADEEACGEVLSFAGASESFNIVSTPYSPPASYDLEIDKQVGNCEAQYTTGIPTGCDASSTTDYVVGDKVYYTMRYKNNGPDDVENVVLVDQYPTTLKFVGTTFFSDVDDTSSSEYSPIPTPTPSGQTNFGHVSYQGIDLLNGDEGIVVMEFEVTAQSIEINNDVVIGVSLDPANYGFPFYFDQAPTRANGDIASRIPDYLSESAQDNNDDDESITMANGDLVITKEVLGGGTTWGTNEVVTFEIKIQNTGTVDHTNLGIYDTGTMNEILGFTTSPEVTVGSYPGTADYPADITFPITGNDLYLGNISIAAGETGSIFIETYYNERDECAVGEDVNTAYMMPTHDDDGDGIINPYQFYDDGTVVAEGFSASDYNTEIDFPRNDENINNYFSRIATPRVSNPGFCPGQPYNLTLDKNTTKTTVAPGEDLVYDFTVTNETGSDKLVYFEDTIPVTLSVDELNMDKYECIYETPLYESIVDEYLSGDALPSFMPQSLEKLLEDRFNFTGVYPTDPNLYPACMEMLNSPDYVGYLGYIQGIFDNFQAEYVASYAEYEAAGYPKYQALALAVVGARQGAFDYINATNYNDANYQVLSENCTNEVVGYGGTRFRPRSNRTIGFIGFDPIGIDESAISFRISVGSLFQSVLDTGYLAGECTKLYDPEYSVLTYRMEDPTVAVGEYSVDTSKGYVQTSSCASTPALTEGCGDVDSLNTNGHEIYSLNGYTCERDSVYNYICKGFGDIFLFNLSGTLPERNGFDTSSGSNFLYQSAGGTFVDSGVVVEGGGSLTFSINTHPAQCNVDFDAINNARVGMCTEPAGYGCYDNKSFECEIEIDGKDCSENYDDVTVAVDCDAGGLGDCDLGTEIKNISSTSVVGGDQITLDVDFCNYSVDAKTDTVAEFSFPSQMSLVSIDADSTGITPTQLGNKLFWDGIDYAAGTDCHTVSMTFDVEVNLVGSVDFDSAVGAKYNGEIAWNMDAAIADNADMQTINPGVPITSTITTYSGGKTFNASTPGPFMAGDTVTYDLSFNSLGAGGFLTVTDYYDPAFLTYVPDGSETSVDTTAGIIVWEDIPVGGGWGTPVTFAIADAASGITPADDIINTVEYEFDTGIECECATDTDPANDASDVSITVIDSKHDLALIKTLSGSNYFQAGETVTFDILVENQGTFDAENVTITDYFPMGLTLADAAWTNDGMVGPGTSEYTIASLLVGESMTIPVSFTVNGDTMGEVINWAEISAETALDENGVAVTGGDEIDIDSTPDADNTNDAGGEPESVADDFLAGNGTGVVGDGVDTTDEDDHDPELINVVVYDLALMKEYSDFNDLSGDGNLSIGDEVIFEVSVINQGTVDADNVMVTDYFPLGLTSSDGTVGPADSTLSFGAIPAGGTGSVLTTFTINGDEPTTMTNWAEISAEDAVDDMGAVIMGLEDVDSMPDSTNFNQDGETDDLDDDNVVDEDGKDGGDEDDHDPAQIVLGEFDMALTKVLTSTGPFFPGDDVTFTIELFNQSEDFDASNITVTDYIPTGLTLNDANWTDNGDGTATSTYTGTLPLVAGGVVSSDTMDITFTVDATAVGMLTNWAEISEAQDGDGNIMADIDSTPDADNFNQDGETDDKDDDDVIDGDGMNGGDEDDHDPAMVVIEEAYDLALTKDLTTPAANTPVYPGDSATFTITVYNQGNMTATDIEVTDYIPEGLTVNDAAWIDNGDGTATLATPIASLAPSASTTITITLDVNQYFSGTAINWAEISGFLGATGTPETDIDSTPDADNFNQDGETDDKDDDNVIDEDGTAGGDEDDHDPAMVMGEIYDLALTKTFPLGAPTAYGVGDDIEFVITITNQGTVDAVAESIVDYFPEGLTLNDANWSTNGTAGPATATYNNTVGPIAPGDSMDITVMFTNNGSVNGQVLNWAEIADDDAQETYATNDTDSMPNADQFSEPGETDDMDDDDVNGEDGKNGGDEDDHDLQAVQLDYFDLALTKSLTSSGPFYPGSLATFSIEVTNQGTVDTNMFTITDYIPAGMSLADTAWTSVSGTEASYTYNGTLAPNTSTTIDITLSVDDYILGTLTNWAEVSADDGAYLGGDRDSTPDTTNDGTTESPEDDAIDNENGDEDDHDPAAITIDPFYDLALIKYLTTTTVVEPGDTATFEIKVTNQGNIVAEGIEVTDYIPYGLILNDADWTDNGDGTATYTIPGQIAPAGDMIIEIDLQVESFVNDLTGTIVNWAEISADNAAEFGGDVDSMPDADNFNTPGETDDLDDDNVENEDGKAGGDEDDHDAAVLPIGDVYDLALTKKLISTGNIFPGTVLTFELEVMNQGNMPASDIEVTDYIPAEFTLVDAAWTDNGDGTATQAIPGTLAAGDSITMTILMEVNQHILGSVINWAEISNDDGEDVDSNPDADPENDSYDDTDDVVDNTNGDEDDHDPAEIIVEPYPDLALTKIYNGEFPFVQDLGEAEFLISVTNQGNIHAEDVVVTDYFPAGLVLSDAAWTNNNDGTASSSPVSIPVGETLDIPVVFTADLSQGGSDYMINWAEISQDNFAEFGGDVDSMPNTDPNDDNQPELVSDPTNDVIDEDGKNGGDEDDHDPAELIVLGDTDGGGNGRVSAPTSAPTPTPVPEFESAPELSEVEGCVHHDVNGDGIYDSADTGLAGMPVSIKDANGNVIGTMETDADGCYHFVELPAGEYCVHYEDMSDEYNPISSNPGALKDQSSISTAKDQMTHCLELGEGDHSVANDFGLNAVIATAEVDGCVHHDVNGDGIYDSADTGLAGMPVSIKDANGNVIGTMETDIDGCYHFVELPAGEYCVHYEDVNAIYDPVSSNPGAVSGSTESIAIGEMTHCLTLEDGNYSASNDFGLAFAENEPEHNSAIAPLELPTFLPKTGAQIK